MAAEKEGGTFLKMPGGWWLNLDRVTVVYDESNQSDCLRVCLAGAEDVFVRGEAVAALKAVLEEGQCRKP